MIEDQLNRYVEIIDGDEGACWIWTGSRKPAGYGQMMNQGKCLYVHRVVYELLVGPIPPKMQLDHLCRVRECCNPDHLEVVTNAENGQRGKALITHCPQGHPYEGDNLYITPAGHRQCHTCKRHQNRLTVIKRSQDRK